MPSLPARASSALRGFYALIDRLATEIAELPLHEKVQTVIQGSGLRDHHAKEKDNKGEARVENLDELVNAAEGFEPDNDDGLSPLGAFLAHATLESGETQAATGLDCVQLMTLHAAKGLEFPTVFIVGLEEGLFPSERAAFDADRLPEERRLCYVGLTRAMQRLYLTHAESRRIFGHTAYRDASRFLSELPPEALEDVRPRIAVSRPLYSAPSATSYRNRPVAEALETRRRSRAGAPLAGEDAPDAPRRPRPSPQIRRRHDPPFRRFRGEPASPRQLRERRPENPHVRTGPARASLLARNRRARSRSWRRPGTLLARSEDRILARSQVPGRLAARRGVPVPDAGHARGGGCSRVSV